MRVAVLGGGPAGLYFAYLFKRRRPEADVMLFEQNPPDATFGFGVVFSDRAMDFLRADDPETADIIAREMETWSDITLVHRGAMVAIDGVGFSAIGRLKLLKLLQDRLGSTDVQPRYNTIVTSIDEMAQFDLVVAADGINSFVRKGFEGDFGTSLSYSGNKFAWFGTTKRFETLTQTFVKTPFGHFNAHHYRYSPTMSTFIVECDRETWLRAKFDSLNPDESKALCEDAFADVLQGHGLVANKSTWRNFPWLWNDRWSHRNMVLVGDALHTAHYSIGSGTRLALEDVIALAKALDEYNEIPEALAAYESARRPIVEKLVKASKTSALWYENFVEHMQLEPLDFAHSYITRSGRIDDERLRTMAPKFMAAYESGKTATMTELQK